MKFNNVPNRCFHIEEEEVWISRSVTVLTVLVVVADGKSYVPLNLRGPDLPSEVGKWGLSGGYLDYGETLGEAVVREAWEEMGLDLLALRDEHRLIGSLDQPSYVYSSPRGQRQNVTMHYPLLLFLNEEAELPKLEPKVGPGEVTDVGWFPLEQALKMSLSFRHQDIIQQYLESRFREHGLREPGFREKGL
ncbi:MAG: NUDIX domain-containing protein [Cyanobacteria bacterium J06628_6]